MTSHLYRCLLLLSLYYQQITPQAEGIKQVQGSDCSDIVEGNKTSTCGIYTIKPEGSNSSFPAEGIKQAQGYDCSDIWEGNNASTSGIYTIKPEGSNSSFQVFCEMTATRGWTLMQKHNGEDGLSFDETWDNYENGFGRLGGEHWLGLKYIYRLTHQKNRPCKLRISIGDFAGKEPYAEYNPFSVGDGNNFYRLSAGNYSGTAGDGFRGYIQIKSTNQHGSFFSTEDRPNDNCHPSCPIGDMRFISCSFIQSAGWWFNACGSANLNGAWHRAPNHVLRKSSVSWPTWNRFESLKFSKMYLIHH
ncbi:angiopoietin-related protein 5-like [Mixophyes fleayi]|uniref:angiopoietin-related protein 5-like n=1 Tax=Mixophyes fleayi TaxID=3061075 RepID=UPI003F4E3B11